ncbi:MAG: DUF3276 family protein [Alistipes sp.]|nr:DUF3276 family protein [Alistipes sp.]
MSFEGHSHREHEEGGEEIFSKAIRAGKRTYYFDVKATRGNDYFITITESRRRMLDDGTPTYTRQQMHLYKEDFAKFITSLGEVIDYIKAEKPEYFENQE